MAFKKVNADLSKATGADFDVKAEAVKLYASGMTCAQVAERIGAANSTVSAWLKAAGVTRSIFEALKMKKAPPPQAVAEVERLYIRERLSLNEIAAKTGMSFRTVRTCLAHANVRLRGKAGAQELNPAWLPVWRRRYEAGEAADKIGADFGITGTTVIKHLRPLGVIIRDRAEVMARQRTTQRTGVLEAKRLHAEGLSNTEIAQRLGRTRQTIRIWLKQRVRPYRSVAQRGGHRG